MKAYILTFALTTVLAITGCVAPVEKMAVTPSGKPEAIINAPIGDIKAAIIGELVNHGYNVDQDTDYMLKMSRPLSGGESVGASLAIGNAYSTNRRITVYTFVKQADGIRVVASSAWSAQMPGGQVNTSELTDNGNTFNTFQTQLNTVKNRLEKR